MRRLQTSAASSERAVRPSASGVWPIALSARDDTTTASQSAAPTSQPGAGQRIPRQHKPRGQEAGQQQQLE